jgi:hypothetical protein
MAPVSGRSIPTSFGANEDAAGKFKKIALIGYAYDESFRVRQNSSYK